MKHRTRLAFVCRLAVLGVGIGLWGWWLAALAVPPFATVVIGLLLAYGLAVGWGSVVPTSAALSMAIALVVAFDVLPAFWPANLHYKYWAYTVLLLWAIGLGLVGLLAGVGQRLGHRRSLSRWGGRGIIWASLLLLLWGGATLYQAQWPAWVPWDNLVTQQTLVINRL